MLISPARVAAATLLFLVAFILLFFPTLGCGIGGKGRDASVQANLNTVRMGLEGYAMDHDGHYPSRERLVQELTQHNYLPGNAFPRSPWSGEPQRVAIGVAGSGLPTAAEVAAHRPLPARGTVIGKGEVAAQAPANAYQYGAILYDFDPKSQTYVLYGVGQQNKSARLAAVVSNQDQP